MPLAALSTASWRSLAQGTLLAPASARSRMIRSRSIRLAHRFPLEGASAGFSSDGTHRTWNREPMKRLRAAKRRHAGMR